MPNEKSLPKLTQRELDSGWTYAEAVIDDNLPNEESFGHGTGVACVAAGLGLGVASASSVLLALHSKGC